MDSITHEQKRYLKAYCISQSDLQRTCNVLVAMAHFYENKRAKDNIFAYELLSHDYLQMAISISNLVEDN